MRKKIIITILLIIIILQTLMPIKVNAFKEQNEIISIPAKIQNYKTDQVVSETSGIDVATGLFLEPTVVLVSFVVDALMEVFTAFMTQSGFELVMVPYDELPEEMKVTSEETVNPESTGNITEEGQTVKITISDEDLKLYKRMWGLLDLQYPNFAYTPEEIFGGKIDLLDINFMQETNKDDNWNRIRDIVSSWYKVLRMIAIIGLLSVLIYTGIKIIIASSAKDKAKYKEMIVNWFMAVVLLFSMHYIMSFILNIIEEIMELFKGIAGYLEVHVDGKIFKTNLMGFARFQMQKDNFTAKLGHLIIYVALVTYTFKFTFLYLKRVLTTAVLTLISPIIAIMYPIDKMNGKAKGFQTWLRDYTYNALLQPMHYILYYILVTSSLTLAARNPLYGIAALMFISNAEKLLKKIFGFNKASGDTVNGIAGAFATGAVTSALMNVVKNPLHPFGGGKGSGGKSGKGSSNNSYFDDNEELSNVNEDTVGTENLLNLLYGDALNGNNSDEEVTGEGGSDVDVPVLHDSEDSAQPIPGVDNSLYNFREGLTTNIKDLGGLYFDDGYNNSIDGILSMISNQEKILIDPNATEEQKEKARNRIAQLKGILDGRIDSTELPFISNGIPLQYIDGDDRSTKDIMSEIIRLRELYNNPNLTDKEKERCGSQIHKLLQIAKRRMAQNRYIHGSSMFEELLKQQRAGLFSPTNNGDINSRLFGDSGSKPLNGDSSEADAPKPDKNEKEEATKVNKHQRDNEQGDKPHGDNPQGNKTRRNRQEETNAWKEFKKKHPHVRGAIGVGKTLMKPVWDSERNDNGRRLAGKVFKGVIGAGVGITAAAVQAGISITDGKYKVSEGIATVSAGMAGVSKMGNGKLARTYKEALYEGEDGKPTEEYGRQWFNRDDVIQTYRKEFQDDGKVMRRRAVDNYITRGITDCDDQIQAMKYANQLKKERGLNEEQADKLAIATLQYKQSLNMYSNYAVLFDKDKRKKYVEAQANAYNGSKSKETIIKLHEDLIQNVLDFDRANR